MEIINRLDVKGLYGFYDYSITCATGEQVKILTGPNGYGKTTLLQMIHHLLGADFWYFYTIPFLSFELELSNGERFVLKKVKSDDELDVEQLSKTNPLVVSYYKGEKEIESFKLPNDYETILKLKANWNQLQSQLYISGLTWEDFLRKYYHLNMDGDVKKKGPNTLMALQVGHGSLSISRLTQSQVEVLGTNGMPFKQYMASTVDLNNHLRNEDFRAAIASYNEVSQKLDASYIKRLMDMKPEPPQDAQSQKNRLKELRERTLGMAKYGLTKTDEMIDSIPEQYSDTVELYIRDTQKKLDALQPFYEKLRLFDELINSRALAHKKMILSPNGIVLKDENNVDVPLNGLSSGEQHLLILFYHLIFQAKPGSVIFIDEPEMSMHPAWLERMLSDFKTVAQMNEFQIIFATHSVAFIAGQWNLSDDLYKLHRKA